MKNIVIPFLILLLIVPFAIANDNVKGTIINNRKESLIVEQSNWWKDAWIYMTTLTETFYYASPDRKGGKVKAYPVLSKAVISNNLTITSITTQNCTETSPNIYTAEWEVVINHDGFIGGDISYRRNSEANQTFTPTGSSETVTISGVSADGGASDTIYVFAASDVTCADTMILKRPVPCPSTVAFNVFCPENIAPSGTASASSEAFGGLAANAINGTTSGDIHHSALETDPWWQVDLATSEAVQEIVIWNRDGQLHRLDGAIVELLDASSSVVFTHTIGTAGSIETINVGSITGKTVRLRLVGSDKILNFFEVQVFSNTGICAGGAGEICSDVTATSIVGSVWEDFNYNGALDETNLVGVQGIEVILTDDCGATVTTTYTDVNGNYEYSSLTSGTTYRVEFILPAVVSCWAKPTRAGTDNGTLVQFVQPGNCANLGIASPADYCQADPTLFTPCYVNGLRSSSPNADAFVSFPYSSTGTTAPPSHSTFNDVGSTWGVAINPKTETVFTSAFLKRHSDIGPAGLGGIYAIPYTGTAILPVSATYTIANVGTIPSRDLSGLNDYSYDENVFSEVGKIGLGDLEISENFDTLYVVNLAQQRIEVLDISVFNNTGVGTDISTGTPILIPDLGAACDDRPFGLKVYRGKIYIGKVCADNITATVQVYDLNTSTWNIPTNLNEFDISFTRGELHNDKNICDSWNSWEDTFSNFEVKNDDSGSYDQYDFTCHPQPIFSDIEFDDDGAMILGFVDRAGHQLGASNYSTDNTTPDTRTYRGLAGGDMMRAGLISGTFVLETGGQVNGSNGCGANGQGNGGGEFYCGDFFDQHLETVSGGLALKSGSGNVVVTVMDPLALWSGGIKKFSNTTGTSSEGYQLYQNDPGGSNDNIGVLGKSTGLGDLEMLCDPAPLEIGNYVWCDSLQNGIQDGCERGINDLIVQLYDRNGLLVGQDSTINGQYYFNEYNVDTTGIIVDGSGVATANTAWSGMSYSTQYFIVFGGGQFASDEFTVGSETYGITAMVNAGSNDNIDSDVDGSALTSGSLGTRPDGLPFIDMTTSAIGCGDHKYDLGLSCVCLTVDSLITDRTICSGELVDTLAVTTTFSNPDSIAFVYFASPQTDSNLIYTNGTAIETVQISATSDTVRITDISFPVNTGTTPVEYYVYAIVKPTPSVASCRPYEEMLVTVNACDWGDLPDTSNGTNASDYQTLAANNGPVHVIIPGLNLGSTIDGEVDGQPSTDALGDDTDEDGLLIFESLNIHPGSTFRLPLSYTNTTGNDAHIEAWIDWNNNGEFDVGEQVFNEMDAGSSAFNKIEITAPTNAVLDADLGLRIRISNQDNMTPYGQIESGEVEDYLINLKCKIELCVPITTTIKKQ